MISIPKTSSFRMLFLTCVVVSSAAGYAQTPSPQTSSHGPPNGYLLITGGATEPRDYRRLVELGGGDKARIVVIPNASVTAPATQAELQEKYCGPKSPFAAFPQVPCTVMYTNDHATANSEAFVAPLKTATAVWFVGGRHWRIADAYLGTLTLKEFFHVLDRGGVIGGGSAGATIQGSYMVRGSAVPDDNTIMMAPGHETGFGFLTNATIDQHVDVRHRENDLAPVMKAHPDLLGFGLDQATSMTVHGDTLTVNGPKRVAVWDGKDHDGKGYYYLQTGDALNLVTRVPTFAPHPAQQ
jgi:cyanophycinase